MGNSTADLSRDRPAVPMTAYFDGASNLPPAFSQSAFAWTRKPSPLQAFWPLQACEEVLQALVPLQEFTPMQWPIGAAAASAAEAIGAVENIAAAAAARAAVLSLVLFFMMELLLGY
jgi:hypothetical protein